MVAFFVLSVSYFVKMPSEWWLSSLRLNLWREFFFAHISIDLHGRRRIRVQLIFRETQSRHWSWYPWGYTFRNIFKALSFSFSLFLFSILWTHWMKCVSSSWFWASRSMRTYELHRMLYDILTVNFSFFGFVLYDLESVGCSLCRCAR